MYDVCSSLNRQEGANLGGLSVGLPFPIQKNGDIESALILKGSFVPWMLDLTLSQPKDEWDLMEFPDASFAVARGIFKTLLMNEASQK